jgi:hypothetical protein
MAEALSKDEAWDAAISALEGEIRLRAERATIGRDQRVAQQPLRIRFIPTPRHHLVIALARTALIADPENDRARLLMAEALSKDEAWERASSRETPKPRSGFAPSARRSAETSGSLSNPFAARAHRADRRSRE